EVCCNATQVRTACRVGAPATHPIISPGPGSGRGRPETLNRRTGVPRRMPPFELLAPATPEEAMALLRTAGPNEAAVIAGGTDLLLDVADGRLAPSRVISLRRLPWRTLDWNGTQLTVGSTLPLRALELDPELPRRLPGLYQAVRAVGGVALRHRATLGGNL